eukprot:7382339-Prymnesium_polylepis.1
MYAERVGRPRLGAAHQLFRALRAVARILPRGSEATRAVNMCKAWVRSSQLCRCGSEVLRYVQQTSRVPHEWAQRPVA